MSTRVSHAAPKDLARGAFVLSPARGRRAWLVWSVLVVAALCAGAAGSWFYSQQRFEQEQQQSASVKDVQQLQSQLEQASMTLRVSEGRSRELERQIDALNQRLRESQEELTFFRKTREAKH